jgi:hypothetical protein
MGQENGRRSRRFLTPSDSERRVFRRKSEIGQDRGKNCRVAGHNRRFLPLVCPPSPPCLERGSDV